MPVNAPEIKKAVAPPDPGGSPTIPCLAAEIAHHEWMMEHLLPPFRRLSTIEGLAQFADEMRDRGVAIPEGGASPEEEAAANRARVQLMETAAELREEIDPEADPLRWIMAADQAHVLSGDVDAYSTLEELRDHDVTAYIARHAIEADGTGPRPAEDHRPYRVRMAVYACLMEAWTEIRTPEPRRMMSISHGLIWGGAYLGGENDSQGREWLTSAYREALAAATEADTPAARYLCLAFAAAAEADLCGAMVATELAHAALVAHEIGAEEDLWPAPFSSAIRYASGEANYPGAEQEMAVGDAKVRTGRRLMKAARQVLNDDERARWRKEIDREGLKVLREASHG